MMKSQGDKVMSTSHGRSIIMLLVTLAMTMLVRQPTMAADGTISYQHDEGKTLVARQGDTVLWQFNYAQDLPKPFFHPVTASDGSVLTWNSPPDHRWHHGLWFCWKYINGVNYWEPNNQIGKPDGRTQWDGASIETRPDGSATIQMRLKYRVGDAEPVLTEKRVIAVSAPDADGIYHFNWTCTFTAVADNVVLDRTPLPDEPGGEVYGGYAGLSVRLAKDLADREATSDKGPIQFSPEARYRGKANAMDYAGVIDGRAVGIAICDHPENLNHPIKPRYVIRSNVMSYYSPAVICYKPHTINASESLTLRYRVIVHSGKWNADRLGQEYERFVADSEREDK